MHLVAVLENSGEGRGQVLEEWLHVGPREAKEISSPGVRPARRYSNGVMPPVPMPQMKVTSGCASGRFKSPGAAPARMVTEIFCNGSTWVMPSAPYEPGRAGGGGPGATRYSEMSLSTAMRCMATRSASGSTVGVTTE